MNVYTVSFFGHRQLSDPFAVEKRLEPILRDLIMTKEYIEFLVGRDGEFDQLVSSAVRRAAEAFGSGNTAHILVLPYERADHRDNCESYEAYYDEIEICRASAEAYFKAAIEIRNREMAGRADLIICAIERSSGGAYTATQYALKQGKQVINLAE